MEEFVIDPVESDLKNDIEDQINDIMQNMFVIGFDIWKFKLIINLGDKIKIFGNISPASVSIYEGDYGRLEIVADSRVKSGTVLLVPKDTNGFLDKTVVEKRIKALAKEIEMLEGYLK